MKERFKRQSFLGPHSGDILNACRVGVIGLGGGGSHVVQQLAHLGVGSSVLYDADYVEEHNLNRLVGATAADAVARTLKTVVAERVIRGIQPSAGVLGISQEWQENALPLRDCDVVFGCVDSYIAREEIERLCRRFLIPYIDVGMDVTALGDGFVVSGQVILSSPGEPCFRCLGFLRDDLLAREAERYGAAGNRPQVVWANGALVCAAVGVFVQLVTPWHPRHQVTEFLEYDGNAHTLARSNRLAYALGKPCPHFPDPPDVGDPFWP